VVGKTNYVAVLCLAGLPAGDYRVLVNGKPADQITVKEDEWKSVSLPIGIVDTYDVTIQPTSTEES